MSSPAFHAHSTAAATSGSVKIGRLKKALGVDVYQPEREKQVIEHVRGVACEGPLGPEAIARLFERIIDEARSLERRAIHDSTENEPIR